MALAYHAAVVCLLDYDPVARWIHGSFGHHDERFHETKIML